MFRRSPILLAILVACLAAAVALQPYDKEVTPVCSLLPLQQTNLLLAGEHCGWHAGVISHMRIQFSGLFLTEAQSVHPNPTGWGCLQYYVPHKTHWWSGLFETVFLSFDAGLDDKIPHAVRTYGVRFAVRDSHKNEVWKSDFIRYSCLAQSPNWPPENGCVARPPKDIVLEGATFELCVEAEKENHFSAWAFWDAKVTVVRPSLLKIFG
jgi:hypothetical protein